MQIKKEKRRFSLFLLPLLCLTLFVGAMATGVTYSSYTSSSSDSDSTTVADFSVTSVGQILTDNTVTMNCKSILTAGAASYTFTVNCDSAVTVSYGMTITLAKALPTGVTMTMTKGDTLCTLTQNGNTVTVENAGIVEAGVAQSDTYTIYFNEATANTLAAPSAKQKTGHPYYTPLQTSTKYGVTVSISAEQID